MKYGLDTSCLVPLLLAAHSALEAASHALDALVARWAELEEKQA